MTTMQNFKKKIKENAPDILSVVYVGIICGTVALVAHHMGQLTMLRNLETQWDAKQATMAPDQIVLLDRQLDWQIWTPTV